MSDNSELSALLSKGPELLSRQLGVRKRVREKSKSAAKDLLDAHWSALSVIASATDRMGCKAGKSTPELSHLLALSASFIQGIEICETTISEGLYYCASALLKQEMETLAAICETREKRRQDGKTPNVKSFGELSVLYGDLNGMAHVSEKDWIESCFSVNISPAATGASLVPTYNEKLFNLLYALHVVFVAILAIEVEHILKELYGEGYTALERRVLGGVLPILRTYGWIMESANES